MPLSTIVFPDESESGVSDGVASAADAASQSGTLIGGVVGASEQFVGGISNDFENLFDALRETFNANQSATDWLMYGALGIGAYWAWGKIFSKGRR